MQVRKACWLTSTHIQMDDVSRESHARWSEAPFPASSERKWHRTRRGREGEGVNHRTNAALHHRFLGLPDHPRCQCRLHSAPYACVWLCLCGLAHSELTFKRRRSWSSMTCLWKRLTKRHMKAGDPWRWFKWAPLGREFGLTLAVAHQICMQGKVLFVLFHACLFDTAPLRKTLYFCKGPHVAYWPCTVFTHSVCDTLACLLVYLFVCTFENMRAKVCLADTQWSRWVGLSILLPRALAPQTITNRILKCCAAVHGRPSAWPQDYEFNAHNSHLCSPALLGQSRCQAVTGTSAAILASRMEYVKVPSLQAS